MALTERRRRNKPQSLVMGCAGDLPADGTTYFFGVIGSGSLNAVSQYKTVLFCRAGYLRNFCVNISVAPGGATSRTFYIYINGAATALTVVFGAADSGLRRDQTNRVAVNVGDLVCIEMIPAGGFPAITRMYGAFEFWST